MTEEYTERFTAEITRTGLPCLWEAGGGMCNTGHSQIVCAADGSPKKAIYVRRYGHLALQEHALIPVKPGDIVVSARHHRGDFRISIWKLGGLCRDEEEIFFPGALISYWNGYEWSNPDIGERFQAAVQAAKEKATCYHCRSPHFIKQG